MLGQATQGDECVTLERAGGSKSLVLITSLGLPRTKFGLCSYQFSYQFISYLVQRLRSKLRFQGSKRQFSYYSQQARDQSTNLNGLKTVFLKIKNAVIILILVPISYLDSKIGEKYNSLIYHDL